MSYLNFKRFTAVKIRSYAIFVFFLFLALFLGGHWYGSDRKDVWGNPLLPDLAQFYVAGELARTGNIGRIYQAPEVWQKINQTLGTPSSVEGTYFFYPPFVAWICAPLSFLPYHTVAWFYFACSLMAGLGLGWGIAVHFLGRTDPARTAAWLLVASVPFWRCVMFGQNGLISLAIGWLFYWCWKQKRFFWAGLTLALGGYKPQLFWGLWLWVILFGSGLTRVGLALGLAALGGVGAWDGGQLWKEWWGLLGMHMDAPGSAVRMHSIHNAFELWFRRPTLWEEIVWIIVAMVWALGFIVATQKRVDDRMRDQLLAFALLGSLLLTPRLYNYDLVLVFPLLVGWWVTLGKKDNEPGTQWRKWFFGLIILSLYISDVAAMLGVPLVTILGMICLWIMYQSITLQERVQSQNQS
jgi:hypothetical protein